MSRRPVDHARLTPEAFSEALEAIGIGPSEFARLTGASLSTVRRALLDGDHPDYGAPPYWFTVVVGLMHLPGGTARARQLFTLHALPSRQSAHPEIAGAD